jgi:hypothetical protein
MQLSLQLVHAFLLDIDAVEDPDPFDSKSIEALVVMARTLNTRVKPRSRYARPP